MRALTILLLSIACSACSLLEREDPKPRETVRVERLQIPALLLRQVAAPEPAPLPPRADLARREAAVGRHVLDLRESLGRCNLQLGAIAELTMPKPAAAATPAAPAAPAAPPPRGPPVTAAWVLPR